MTDMFTVRMVAGAMMLTGLTGLVLGFLLAAWGKTVPDFIISVTSAAVGAGSALLVTTRSQPPEQP